jgi:hypothetical protein
MWGASPNGAHPWLHAKPLDAAIGQVPAPYCPGSHHGQRFQKEKKNTTKTQLLPSVLTVDQCKKAIKSQDPQDSLLTSLMQQALTLTLTPLVKLKRSATF